MYGDTEVMRRRSAELREQGVDLRTLADRLVAQTEQVGWTGRAAAALGERIRERAAHLRDVAAHHENAADLLDLHLSEVDRLKEAIAGIERKADTLVADARARIARTERPSGSDVRLLPAPEDELLAAFTPPPKGHRDWLSVELPGL